MAAKAHPDVPAGVKVIGVIAMAIGLVQIVGGLLMIIFNGDVEGYSSSGAVVFGIITLLVGAIYVWAGRGLLNDDPAALVFCLFVSALKIAYDVIWLIVLGLDGIGVGTLIALIINIIVFAVLWRARGAFGLDEGAGTGGAGTPGGAAPA